MNKYNSLLTLFSNIAQILKINLNVSKITPFSFASKILLLEKPLYLSQYLQNNLFSYTNNIVSSICSNAFCNCTALTSINFSSCITIGENAFKSCHSLTSINFPVCTEISKGAFYDCTSLTSINFPMCTKIAQSAFQYCLNLISLYLTNSSVCSLEVNAFSSTPIGGYSTSAGRYGSIFVPRSLVSAYKSATNWTYFSNRIFAIEDYPPPSN